MFMNLSPGAIGVRASLSEALELAQAHGFAGVDFSIGEVTKMAAAASIDEVRDLFTRTGVRPGCWGLPVDWRGEERKWREDVAWLRRHAALAQEIGCVRTATWIPPVSDDRPFKENFEFHVQRFRPAAEVLRDYGCSLGLEFIGPKTSRAGHTYEFISTMDGMLELCETIGTGNVGLLLDAWHWYTAHGTLDDLRRLTKEQVVTVHVNDAPAGIPVDEQMDNVRCLPGETGVIDLVGFLTALDRIGYDGPITPEPFNKRVNEMAPADAVRTTADALTRVWQAAGLP
ncbi:MAG: sugar phosphate isomerase/epimerase [Candidatus Latescibacteria bacterium]|nr:sugar phosphate isomerase/epimerase [Candidatus Latescibacterota bacterium]